MKMNLSHWEKHIRPVALLTLGVLVFIWLFPLFFRSAAGQKTIDAKTYFDRPGMIAEYRSRRMIRWIENAYDLNRSLERMGFLEGQKTAQLGLTGDIDDSEEYAVYSAILAPREDRDPGDPPLELAIIQRQTGFGLLPKNGIKETEMQEATADLWKDFMGKNQASSNLGHSLTLNAPYLLFNASDQLEVNRKMYELQIFRTAFIQFSRVGFNEKRDQALVHISSEFIGRPSAPIAFALGRLVLLKKVNGIWKIETEQETFIT